MNFTFYIIGNPNGYDQYPLDTTSEKFKSTLNTCRTESQISVYRNNQLIQYCYIHKIPGNSGLFLGFTLAFTGIYCKDLHSLNALFDNVFDDILLQGELLRFQNNKYSFKVSKFIDNHNEIKRISKIFSTILENDLNNQFATIPSSFRIGNGEIRLSLKESASDISDAISQYDIVHLSNDEKSISELERTQKMLSALYMEHSNLKASYRKVLNQKRNFKLVIILSLILLGCITGFLLFNELLNDKNIEIRNLRNKITQLSDDNNDLLSSNKNLENTISEYKIKLDEADRYKQETTDSLQIMKTKNSDQQIELEELKNNIDILESNIRLATEQLIGNSNTIRNLQNGEKYKVWGENTNYAYIYYQYGNSYSKTSYTISDNTVIRVYHFDNGYAMTSIGYLRSRDIKKL